MDLDDLAQTYETLHHCLKEIRGTGHGLPVWVNRACGICYQIGVVSPESCGPKSKVQRLMRELAKEWPEYSGDPEYPVPAPALEIRPWRGRAHWSADYGYDHYEDKWVGEYGAARLRLLDFLIERTTPGSRPGLD